MEIIFILISVTLYLVGFIPYIYHVFHGRVVPHPYSWTVWAIFAMMSGYITFEAQGWTISLFVIIIRSCALSTGAVLGWRHIREIAIGKLDIISILFGGVLIIVNQFIPTTLVIIGLILIDFLVLTPSLKKIWMYPETENILGWIMPGFSGLFLILSFPVIDFTSTGYFIYSAAVNFLVAFLIYRRQLYMHSIIHRIKNYFLNFALKKKL